MSTSASDSEPANITSGPAPLRRLTVLGRALLHQAANAYRRNLAIAQLEPRRDPFQHPVDAVERWGARAAWQADYLAPANTAHEEQISRTDRHSEPRHQRNVPMIVAFALVNKTARSIWAMLTRNEDYRGPVLIGT